MKTYPYCEQQKCGPYRPLTWIFTGVLWRGRVKDSGNIGAFGDCMFVIFRKKSKIIMLSFTYREIDDLE